jgi:hypothetical protein
MTDRSWVTCAALAVVAAATMIVVCIGVTLAP